MESTVEHDRCRENDGGKQAVEIAMLTGAGSHRGEGSGYKPKVVGKPSCHAALLLEPCHG